MPWPGTIPESLGNLTRLWRLFLDKNRLTGKFVEPKVLAWLLICQSYRRSGSAGGTSFLLRGMMILSSLHSVLVY